jgi:hypothetical protein
MPAADFDKRILLGITGTEDKDWQDKLESLKKLRVKEAALFLERFNQSQRKNIYRALFDSGLEKLTAPARIIGRSSRKN